MVAKGGVRAGAGRVGVIKRKYCHYYLSTEEDKTMRNLVSAIRQVETEITRELSKELKCKQYEIAEEVYQHMLQIEEKIISEAIKKVEAAKKSAKENMLKEQGNSIEILVARIRAAEKKREEARE